TKAYKHIGSIHVRLDDIPAAIRAYTLYLKTNPAARDYRVVREALEALGGKVD
ncbi:MAG: hypothetical protein ACI9MR_002312, partial [Myxococcota bacterium]